MKVNYENSLGIQLDTGDTAYRRKTVDYINMKLKSLGYPMIKWSKEFRHQNWEGFLDLVYRRNLLSEETLSPVDKRIQRFLDTFLADVGESVPQIPKKTFVLDKFGLARELALPAEKDEYHKENIDSYRIKQGVLHNPKNDRRTTKGVFHVVEGGLPIPQDKKAVPKVTFLRLLEHALHSAPEDLKELPFMHGQLKSVSTMVSLLLKPLVLPEVAGYVSEKRMEIRFFAPGNLVSNLDFVESIFGNGGDPRSPENDLALSPEIWTGHTGCVILAPHIATLTKKELGLPPKKKATPRQIAEGMCWENEDELYNDGSAFKLCARTEEGVVTIISDNYFGYSKKEVKTQIGYAANLYGLAEEEHAGGALVFPRYNLGNVFTLDKSLISVKDEHNFANAMKSLGNRVSVKPEGYGVDKEYPTVFYIPLDTEFDIHDLTCRWRKNGKVHTLPIAPEHVFVYPCGYKVALEKHPVSPIWRFVGTVAEGTLIHKPCTVSGGGKSEISKSLNDAIVYGSTFISDFDKDMDRVEEVINHDYSKHFKVVQEKAKRSLLSSDRSLGSVIKLLTKTEAYTDAYNKWLDTIPSYIKTLVFVVKRFYDESWGADWRSHFSVDSINGQPGNELKHENQKLSGSYLRVGLQKDGSWSIYKLRQEFIPAEKIQWEDDISASVTVPASKLEGLDPNYTNRSIKFTENCEYRFFQRPDDAKVRGYDKQAEIDLSSPGTFISNFEPMTQENAKEFLKNPINMGRWTKPVQKMIVDFNKDEDFSYFISPADSRIYNGSPTKNPRYLQLRPDVISQERNHIAEMGARLYRGLKADAPLYQPVNAIIAGRRNNPIDRVAGVRPLAVYNPIHFQRLPELFMDFITSVTGKSPSTTGAGVEGALTKGPFNCLVAVTDLNNALLTFLLGDYDGFTTSAGYIGAEHRVEHDVSLLVPELWARLTPQERDPDDMIKAGYLEKLDDFKHKGETILASRLGYRVTKNFLFATAGRLFESPDKVFPESMLKPEVQDMESYVDGIKNICEAQASVAQSYLDAGYDEFAIPPLKALLHIMATGKYKGKSVNSPEVEKLFKYEYVLKSKWYQARLVRKQSSNLHKIDGQIDYLNHFILEEKNQEVVEELELSKRLGAYLEKRKKVESPEYIKKIQGTLGLDPLGKMDSD